MKDREEIEDAAAAKRYYSVVESVLEVECSANAFDDESLFHNREEVRRFLLLIDDDEWLNVE